jgi:hypothetical protein
LKGVKGGTGFRPVHLHRHDAGATRQAGMSQAPTMAATGRPISPGFFVIRGGVKDLNSLKMRDSSLRSE